MLCTAGHAGSAFHLHGALERGPALGHPRVSATDNLAEILALVGSRRSSRTLHAL